MIPGFFDFTHSSYLAAPVHSRTYMHIIRIRMKSLESFCICLMSYHMLRAKQRWDVNTTNCQSPSNWFSELIHTKFGISISLGNILQRKSFRENHVSSWPEFCWRNNSILLECQRNEWIVMNCIRRHAHSDKVKAKRIIGWWYFFHKYYCIVNNTKSNDFLISWWFMVVTLFSGAFPFACVSVSIWIDDSMTRNIFEYTCIKYIRHRSLLCICEREVR